MKKLFVIILSCSMASCSSFKKDCNPDTVSSTFQEDKQITFILDTLSSTDTLQTNSFPLIEEGDKIVFTFIHGWPECADVYDDEKFELLAFEIEKGISSFDFNDEEIVSSNCYYYQGGAWSSSRLEMISKGKIEGRKISEGKWDISIDVTRLLNGPNETIRFSGIFQP